MRRLQGTPIIIPMKAGNMGTLRTATGMTRFRFPKILKTETMMTSRVPIPT